MLLIILSSQIKKHINLFVIDTTNIQPSNLFSNNFAVDFRNDSATFPSFSSETNKMATF